MSQETTKTNIFEYNTNEIYSKEAPEDQKELYSLSPELTKSRVESNTNR